MRSRSRLCFAVLAVTAAFVVAGCGSSGGSDASSDDTTTVAAGDATTTTAAGSDGSATTADDGGSESFGIGIATLKLDGNGHKIEFSGDDGTCEVDPDGGTAKLSVAKDGSTFDLDYDKADEAAATVKFTGEGLDVNAGAGASKPEVTEVVLADGEVTGKAVFDSPGEGADKTYLGEFDILCP